MKQTILRYSVLFVLISFTLQLWGQKTTDFINYTQREAIGFNGTQIQQLNRIISNPLYKAHYYVDLQDLPNISTDGIVTINLPTNLVNSLNNLNTDIDSKEVPYLPSENKQDTNNQYSNNTSSISLIPPTFTLYTFTPLHIETISPTEYTYYGEYEPCGDENGYIHIIAKDGDLFGQININNEVYEIFDLGNRKNIMVHWENSAFPYNECASAENNNVTAQITETSGEGMAGCEVRVLVLFTAAAKAISNPFQRAALSIAQSNEIAKNSQAMVSFTLAGVSELPGFTETSDADATFNALRTNALAQQLRNQFQADIVCLFTDGNFTSPFGPIVGTSGLNNFGNSDFAFTCVEIDAANGRFTFSHELAHDFGCKHNTDNRGTPFTFGSRGHQFLAGAFPITRRTNLTLLPAGGSRIMNWSNPSVNFKGRPTGVEEERDNAAQLTSFSCTVANYRSYTPPTPLIVDILGPEFGVPIQSLTYCVNITNCPNVLSIQWSYSFDGFHYIQFTSGNTTCIELNMPLHGSIYVKVRVICQNGGDVTDFWATHNEDENPKFKGCDQKGEVGKLINNPEFVDFEIFPNPTNSYIYLDINIPISSKIEVNLIDKVGRIVKRLQNSAFEKGKFRLFYEISTLKNENYFIQVKQGNKIITKQFVKI